MSRTSEVAAVEVHHMQPKEADAVSQLFTDVVQSLSYYNEVAKSSEIAKYSADALRSLAAKDPHAVLVAKAGDKLIGFCFSDVDDGPVWLAWFGVLKEFRNRHVGYLLLEELEKTVRIRRVHKIWCDCRTENEGARIVLAKMGYVELCTVRNHWYGQDFILWEKLVA